MTAYKKNKNFVNQNGWLLSFLLVIVFNIIAANPANSEDGNADECAVYTSPFDRRMCAEVGLRHKPFVLIPHKPNYIVGSWTNDLEQQNEIYDDFETKFQISFKVPLTKRDADTKWLWFFGYTQVSVWQMLNFEHSAPFRDTNFEPELMLYRLTNTDILGWKMRLINFGLVDHQSNGQVPPYSRSWNRSYIEFIMERGRNYIGFKAWHRWNESQKDNPDDYEGDDNPEIEEYVGHGELRFLHIGERNNFGLVIRDTTHRDGRGSFQFDWSFPVSDKEGLRLYIQYFKGYGETLIDYNIKRERFGVGLMLADWL